jgi:hypothetical protein
MLEWVFLRNVKYLVCPISAALSWPLTMRRAQAILVIVALLATPLALLARSAAGSMSGCAGMCCPTHGGHAARVLHEKMLCHHGEAGHLFECSMTPGHHGIDYGLISTVAPTTPSAVTSFGAPDVHRAFASEYREAATSRFLSTPLQPPRL